MSAKKQYPFAPGVIEGTDKHYCWLWTDLLGAIALVALAGCLTTWLLRYWL